MKKTLFALMAVVLCVGLIGGAFAYFTDTQSSSANTFTAGNIKLAIATDGGATNWNTTNTAIIGGATAMAPGHSYGPFYAFFQNQGNVSGVVTAVVSYPSGAVYDAYAKVLDVASVNAYENGTWTGSALIAGLWALQICNTEGVSFATAAAYQWVAVDPAAPGDGNTQGYIPTIYGLQYITLHFTPGYAYMAPWNDLTLAPGAFEGDSMTIMLDPSDTVQNASMNITVTATITSN